MTSISYTASNGNTSFQIPFPYISEAHIKVYVNGLAENGWSLQGTSTLVFDGGVVVNDDNIFIERVTPVDEALVDFTSNTGIRERELDTAFNQVLYALQELDVESSGGLRLEATGTSWDGQTKPLTNLGAPSALADAATKGYVDGVVAGSGVLPTPSPTDVGRGLRVRSDNGNVAYEIAPIDQAITVFNVVGDPNDLDAFGVRTNGFGTDWPNRPAANVDLTIGETFGTPESGILGLNGDGVLIPAGATYEITAMLRFRNKIDGTTNNIISVDAGLVDNSFTILDKTPGNGSGITTLGPGGGVINSPVTNGPTFPWVGCTHVHLHAIVTASSGNKTVFLRAVTNGNTGEVVIDEGSHITFRELSS